MAEATKETAKAATKAMAKAATKEAAREETTAAASRPAALNSKGSRARSKALR